MKPLTAAALLVAAAVLLWAWHTRVAAALARRRAARQPRRTAGFDLATAAIVTWLSCRRCDRFHAPHADLGDGTGRCYECGHIRNTAEGSHG